MQIDFFSIAAALGSTRVIDELKQAVGAERARNAAVVAWLAEADRRQLPLGLGYSSTFTYCTEALGFSEDEACNRIGAARAAVRFPRILLLLEENRITMTAVRLLAPHLTEGNHEKVLGDAAGKSRREVEMLVARLAPKPDVPTVARRLPTPAPVAVAAPRPAPAPVVAPLAPERFRLQVTIDGELLEKLELARDMLSHANADTAAVLGRELDALLQELARQRFASTDSPRPATEGTAGSRHIPAAVRREVWLRDLGRCAFVSKDGRRCGERRFVEFHHRHLHAMGGLSKTDNVALRCRAHNVFEARMDFGPRSVPERIAATVPGP